MLDGRAVSIDSGMTNATDAAREPSARGRAHGGSEAGIHRLRRCIRHRRAFPDVLPRARRRSAVPDRLRGVGARRAAATQRGPTQIGLVVVSHLHGDHVGGVPFLLLDAAYNRPRTVLAGRGRTARDSGACARHAGDAVSGHARVRVRPRAAAIRGAGTRMPGPRRRQGVRIAAFEVQHSSHMPPRSAWRSTGKHSPTRVTRNGRRLSSTCRATRTSSSASCTGFDEPLVSHLSHTELCAHASELGCVRMVLTHLGADMLAHTVEARWPCAHDGMIVDSSRRERRLL